MRSRLNRIEKRIRQQADDFCRHAAVIRITGELTDEEREFQILDEVCPLCGLPRSAELQILLLPEKMTMEEWTKAAAQWREPRQNNEQNHASQN